VIGVRSERVPLMGSMLAEAVLLLAAWTGPGPNGTHQGASSTDKFVRDPVIAVTACRGTPRSASTTCAYQLKESILIVSVL